MAGHKDFPYAEFKQVNKKRFRGRTSERVRAGIRQITKLGCSVDVVQTEALRGWIMPGTPESGVPEHHLPFLAYTVHNGKPSYTSFLQLKQIPSFGFYNLIH